MQKAQRQQHIKHRYRNQKKDNLQSALTHFQKDDEETARIEDELLDRHLEKQ